MAASLRRLLIVRQWPWPERGDEHGDEFRRRRNAGGLRVADHICELALGHAHKGLQHVYDRHAYRDEIAEAMEAWGRRLRSVVELRPENVVTPRTA